MNQSRIRQLTQDRRFLRGVLLCVLVAMFALAAKVGWYQPHHSAGGNLASMKAWKSQVAANTAEISGVQEIAAAVPMLAFLLALFFFVRVGLVAAQPQPVRMAAPSRRRHYARPPPVR